MKYYLTFFLSIILFNLYSQDYTIQLKAEYNPDGTTLIWNQKDPKAIEYALKNGYYIERVTIEENGEPLDAGTLKTSAIILADSIFPYSPQEWDALSNQGNDMAELAKELTNNQSFDSIPNNLDDAMDKEKAQQIRKFFLLTLSLKDTTIAKGLGNYYKDTSVIATNKYIYTVHLYGHEELFNYYPGNALLDPINQQESQINEFELLPRDSSCLIKFKASRIGDEYYGFNLYRSLDSISFEQVNDAPILFSKSTDEYIYQQSSLTSNGIKHYFYVRGLKISGREGPISTIKSVIGIPDPIILTVDQNTPQEGIQSDAIVSWTIPNDKESEIEGFNILRKMRKDDLLDTLNSSILSPSSRTFIDANPLPVNYYVVEAIDKNGYSYQSIEMIHQPADSIPPAIPTGLDGNSDKSGKITINWNSNDEIDLSGYRVFMSNLEDGEYSQLTVRTIEDTTYNYTIDLKTLQKKIYFTVRSVDFRENMSEMSEPIEITIPDIIPPSSPNLYRLEAISDGVLAQWTGSQSEDLIGHFVERRVLGTVQWETIYRIKGIDTTSTTSSNDTEGELFTTILSPYNSCIDSSYFLDKDYEYRVVAEDGYKNRAYSEILTVRPIPDMLRGEIEDFNIYVLRRNPALVQSINSLQSTQTSGAIYTGQSIGVLVWNYRNKNKNGLLGFQLFRSVNGSPFREYKLIPPDSYNTLENLQMQNQTLSINSFMKLEYAYLDTDMIKNTKVKYKIMAVYHNGSTSEMSEEKFVNILK